jgi:hypothetical protein
MISLDFTPQDIDALHHERFHHPHPRVQQKMEAIYLKSQGLLHKEIWFFRFKVRYEVTGSVTASP